MFLRRKASVLHLEGGFTANHIKMSHNKEINAVAKQAESPDICCIDFFAPDAPEKFSQSLKTTGKYLSIC